MTDSKIIPPQEAPVWSSQEMVDLLDAMARSADRNTLSFTEAANIARSAANVIRWVTNELNLARTQPHFPAANADLRERIARKIHSRRYQMNAKDTESMFAWYAEKPEGIDRSRMAIYSAYKDADSALEALTDVHSQPGNADVSAVLEHCARLADSRGDNDISVPARDAARDIARQIRMLAQLPDPAAPFRSQPATEQEINEFAERAISGRCPLGAALLSKFNITRKA